MAEFKDKHTERLFNGERDRGFPPNLRIRAKSTLMRVASAQDLADLRIPRSLRLEALAAIETAPTRFGSTASGAFVSA